MSVSNLQKGICIINWKFPMNRNMCKYLSLIPLDYQTWHFRDKHYSQNLRTVGREALSEILKFGIFGLWLPVDQDIIWDVVFTKMSMVKNPTVFWSKNHKQIQV